MTGQSLWTDIALARRSDQELHNSYVITRSTDFAPLHHFFIAAVAALQSRYDAMTALDYQLPMPQTQSILDSMREDMYLHSSAPDGRPSGGSCRYFRETAHACKPCFTVSGDWGSGITVCACTLVTCCCAGDMHSQH